MMQKYTCPCCGYRTLSEEENGSDEICKMCFWQDDYVMNEDPDYWGGANGVCLRQAQRNFITIGASEPEYLKNVKNSGYEKDPLWKPVWENEKKRSKNEVTEVKIEGTISVKDFSSPLSINEFLDEFTSFLDRKGWSFAGDIRDRSLDDDRD